MGCTAGSLLPPTRCQWHSLLPPDGVTTKTVFRPIPGEDRVLPLIFILSRARAVIFEGIYYSDGSTAKPSL